MYNVGFDTGLSIRVAPGAGLTYTIHTLAHDIACLGHTWVQYVKAVIVITSCIDQVLNRTSKPRVKTHIVPGAVISCCLPRCYHFLP